MSLGFAIELIRGCIIQILLLAAPFLLVGMGVGLIIAIFQATTSLQEQTLTFVPKIAAILLILFLLGPWLFGTLMQYTISLFSKIAEMGGG